MKKVNVYIDGFNLYHAIDDLKEPQLKWVNLYDLSKSFLRKEEELIEVHYFSAYPKWRKRAFNSHKEYVKAIEYYGVNTHMGNFKKKKRKCRKCGDSWTHHEEKETDVHIAVKIVEDAFLNKYDRAIIVSADSDLLPPKIIINKNFKNKEIAFVAPPKRKAHARALNPQFEITKGRINKNLMPNTLKDKNGNVIFTIPPQYLL